MGGSGVDEDYDGETLSPSGLDWLFHHTDSEPDRVLHCETTLLVDKNNSILISETIKFNKSSFLLIHNISSVIKIIVTTR